LDQKEERKTRRVGVVGGYVVFWQHEVCCVCMPVKGKGLGQATIIITYTSEKNSKTPNLFWVVSKTL
jgi:hypothetical protein